MVMNCSNCKNTTQFLLFMLLSLCELGNQENRMVIQHDIQKDLYSIVFSQFHCSTCGLYFRINPEGKPGFEAIIYKSLY